MSLATPPMSSAEILPSLKTLSTAPMLRDLPQPSPTTPPMLREFPHATPLSPTILQMLRARLQLTPINPVMLSASPMFAHTSQLTLMMLNSTGSPLPALSRPITPMMLSLTGLPLLIPSRTSASIGPLPQMFATIGPLPQMSTTIGPPPQMSVSTSHLLLTAPLVLSGLSFITTMNPVTSTGIVTLLSSTRNTKDT